MHAKRSEYPRHTRPSILAADRPLVVPMLLRISDLKLRGIVVLVVSKTKGITLVFKNDPLESIVVSSTFDSITSVRNFLQREIEKQLRNLFQEDLPVMIHNLSLRYLQSEQEKQKKQQREERLKQQRLERIKKRRMTTSSPPMSVISDPVRYSSNPQSPMPLDILSMPDLNINSSQINPASVVMSNGMGVLDGSSCYMDSASASGIFRPPHTGFGTFSDLYNYEQLASMMMENGSQQPVTAANLSTLNALYGKRFDEFTMHDLGIEDEEDEEDITSSMSANSLAASATVADIYGDDVDAPWYVTEGPELPSSSQAEQTLVMPLDQEIVIKPTENSLAAKLAQLTCSNHTISPFAYTVEHATYRSLPYTGSKKVGPIPRQKKIPRRRIIRLQMNNNNSNNNTTTANSTASTPTASSSV